MPDQIIPVIVGAIIGSSATILVTTIVNSSLKKRRRKKSINIHMQIRRQLVQYRSQILTKQPGPCNKILDSLPNTNHTPPKSPASKQTENPILT